MTVNAQKGMYKPKISISAYFLIISEWADVSLGTVILGLTFPELVAEVESPVEEMQFSIG